MAEGILVIDKPADWTSHDVVAKLRGILHEKRIGHAGTLDPMATGVLPVFIGRATRAVEFASERGKEYIAGLQLGVVTDTQDTTGNVLEQHPADITREMLESVLPAFRGEIEQIPPMYSAVKIGGKKLYELARRGQDVERKPRPITIRALEILEQPAPGQFLLRVDCSKGTYVRTLCHDIGQTLGCGGALFSLRRTRSAGFTLADAVTLEQVAAAEDPVALLLPVDRYFASYPAVTVPEAVEHRIRNGAGFYWRAEDGTYRVYGPNGDFLMLGWQEAGSMKTIKSFFSV